METTFCDILISILIGVAIGAVVVSFIGMILMAVYYICNAIKGLNNKEEK